MIFWQLLLALVLDALFAEPRKNHPLVVFGDYCNRLEARYNGENVQRAQGVRALLWAIVPILLIVAVLQYWLFCGGLLQWLFGGVVLYLTIGWQSLGDHALQIARPLLERDLVRARENLAMVVSRDTEALSEGEVVSATIETVLENGNDAIFAAIFWFIVLGPVGAVLYRLVNTLDAMWGYRNERFVEFGWAAAKFDDLLNWIPARLCALSYAAAGNFARGYACWQQQGNGWKSPNAGPVMAAGAGALEITIGGNAVYEGAVEEKPSLGEGPAPQVRDIYRALGLINRALLIWLAVVAVLVLFF